MDIFPLNHDEANWIIPCVDNFDKFLGIPAACFNGYIRPFLSYFVFFSRKFFSSPEYAVRIPAALLGVITIILIYQLAKEMYGKNAGMISALLLAFLPWHAIQSRDGREMILTPLFGCLIFLAIFKALRNRSNLWFLLSWLFLSVSAFYTYSASALFVPIFLVILFILRKHFSWVSPKIFLSGTLIFFLILSPLIYLQIKGQLGGYLSKFYWYYYSDSSFGLNDNLGRFLVKAVENFKNNNPAAFESLFFASGGRMLYGAALTAPLLINKICLFFLMFSILISLRRKTPQETILLIWLFLGYLGGVSGVRFFQPRHIIIILAPAVILVGRFIAEIFDRAAKGNFLKRRLFLFGGISLTLSLVFVEIFQLVSYYKLAPFHFEECRRNSYGCKEAALYLAQIPEIESYRIVSDVRMTVCPYLKYISKNSLSCDDENHKQKEIYYITWAPESHPPDYWDGLFTQVYGRLKQKYPEETPIKTFYYPNNLAAIYIFKVKEDIFKFR